MSDTDISIISGLALGIDAVAHQQALNSKLTTVAVLGCGLDIIYPSSNYLLAEKIIKEGGAIISEYPPNTLPKKQHFPARNRIIAGLSLGTVVVEAAVKSGALITAYLALDYNRAVFAVPGDIDRESSRGCNLLIQKGAKAVINVEDIFSELNIDQKIQQIVLRQDLPENETEVEILSIIKDNKKHVDEIIKASKHNIAEIAGALTTLELKGSLENAGGGYWIKVN